LWLVTLLFVSLSAVTVVFAVASRFSPGGQCSVFGHPVLTVISGSMSPVFRTGDLIVDDPVSASQAAHLHVGQVITFGVGSHGQRLFSHRIVAVRRDAGGQVLYTSKGDANNAPDSSPVPSAAVIGVYRWRLADGGYVLEALRQPLVLGLLVLAVLLALAARPTPRGPRRSIRRPHAALAETWSGGT